MTARHWTRCLLLAVVSTVLLAGCGGGGGDGGDGNTGTSTTCEWGQSNWDDCNWAE